LAGLGGEGEERKSVAAMTLQRRRSRSSCAKQHWSWEAIFWSIISVADGSRLTSKAKPWPIQKPEKEPGESTSFVRPLRCAAAYYGCLEASGFVPASEHDGGVAHLRLDDGEREGSDCNSTFLSEVFSVNAGDLFYFADLMGSSVIFVPPPFGINESF
jgi:hypothetical protein